MQSEENQGAESQDNATNMADLSTVEDRDIVKVFRRADGSLVRDSDGNFIVLLVPAMVPSDDGAWENAYQLFLRDTEEVRCKHIWYDEEEASGHSVLRTETEYGTNDVSDLRP